MMGTSTTASHTDGPIHRPQKSRSRHVPVLGGLLLLLILAALILPPLININRYQRRIVASLSTGLGRPVEVSGIHLRLLPRPGVQIAHFAVEEDPAFGAEPILQCSDVSAAFRLLSLWRGRLEIARISLDEPSLDLGRNAQGEWNFASVLTQASRTLQAPTANRIPGRQLRFPYIEATSARINFKQGDEKKPFSFLNADIAVWLEDPNEWRVRFTAQPVRTDMNISASDTGELRVSGSVRRAPSMGEMPLDLDVAWSKAPLGQLSRMLNGEDSGWRADAEAQMHLTGTADDVRVRVEAVAAGFHRAEFEPARPLRLYTVCTGEFLRSRQVWQRIACTTPVGSGRLALSGSVALAPPSVSGSSLAPAHSAPRTADQQESSTLSLAVERVPAGAALELLRHVRNSFAAEATATGTLDGLILLTASPGVWSSPAVSGSIHATQVAIDAPGTVQTSLPSVTLTTETIPKSGTAARNAAVSVHGPLTLMLQPVAVDLGGAQPLVIDGQLGVHTFAIHSAGMASLRRLLPIARGFGVFRSALAGLAPEGTAQMNLEAAGPWIAPVSDADTPAPPATLSGTLRVEDASLVPTYLARPLLIHSAHAAIGSAGIDWSGIQARLGTVDFTASLRMPVTCPSASDCVRHFDVTASEVALTDVRTALHAKNTGRELVRQFMNRVEAGAAAWPPLEGTVRVDRLNAGRALLRNVTASVAISDNSVRFLSFDARTLGGTLQGTGEMLVGAAKPYTAEVQLSRINADDLAALFNERWGGGVLDLSAKLRLSGSTAAELAKSARGSFRYEWSNGGWAEAQSQVPGEIQPSGFRRFDRWTADGSVSSGVLHLEHSLLSSGETTSAVSGSISLDRSLSLDIAAQGAEPATRVTGTLAESAVTTAEQ
jgi:AsmA-like protein